MTRPRLALLFLSIFLAAAGAFASPAPSRQVLAEMALYQVGDLVDFAVRSPRLRGHLTEAETKHLAALYQITENVKAHQRLMRIMDPPEWVLEQLKSPSPVLKFSSDAGEFRLNPDEPERSAVTTERLADPILINLRLLNSASREPSYKSMLQLMIHELGHKIGPSKVQSVVDALAVKIMTFADPYLLSTELKGGGKAEMLALPSEFKRVTFDGGPARTRVILSHNGHVVAHDLDLARVAAHQGRFVSVPEGSGNIMEVHETRLSHLSGTLNGFQVRLQFEIESKSQMMMLDPDLNLRPGAITGNRQAMIPNPRFLPLMDASITNLRAEARMNAPRPGDFTQFYIAEVTAWDYAEASLKHPVRTAHLDDSGRVFAQVENLEPGARAELLLESGGGSLLVRGRSTNGVWMFELPAPLNAAGDVRASQIVIDGSAQTALPEVLAFKSVSAQQLRGRLGPLQVLNNGTWQALSELQDQRISELSSEGALKLRLESSFPLTQIRLRWNKGSALTWQKPENIFGTYAAVSEETLPAKKTEGGFYEFESREVFEAARLPKRAEIIGSLDQGKRVLKEYVVTDASLTSEVRILSPSLKVYTQEFIKVRPRTKAPFCKSIMKLESR